MKIFLLFFLVCIVQNSFLKTKQKPERHLSGQENDDPDKTKVVDPDPNNQNPGNPNPENPELQDPNNQGNPEDKKDGEGEGEVNEGEQQEEEKKKKPKSTKFKSTFVVNPENIQKVIFKEISSLFLKDSPKDDETAMNFANRFIFFTQDGNTWMSYSDFKNQNIQSTNFRFALKESSNSPIVFEINIDMNPDTKKPPLPNPEDIPQDPQPQVQEGEGTEGEKKDGEGTEGDNQEDQNKAPVQREQIIVTLKNEYFSKKIIATKDVFGIQQFYPYLERQVKDAILYQEQIIYSLEDVKDDLLTMLVDTFNAESFTAPTHTETGSMLGNMASGLLSMAKKAIKGAEGVYGGQDGFQIMDSLRSNAKSNKRSFGSTQQKKKSQDIDMDAIQNNSIVMNVSLIDYQQDGQDAIQFLQQLVSIRSKVLASNLPDQSEILQNSLMYFLESTNSGIDDIWVIIFMNKGKIFTLIDCENYNYEKSISFLTKLNLMQQIESQMVYLREIFLRNLAVLQYAPFDPQRNIDDFTFLFENIPQNEFKASRSILKNSQDFQIEVEPLKNFLFSKVYPMFSQFQTSLLAIDYFKTLNTSLQLVKVDPVYDTENHFNNNDIVAYYPLIQPEQSPAFFDRVGKLVFEDNKNTLNSYFDMKLLRIQRDIKDTSQLSRKKVHYPIQRRVYYGWNKGKKTMNDTTYLFKVFNGRRKIRII